MKSFVDRVAIILNTPNKYAGDLSVNIKNANLNATAGGSERRTRVPLLDTQYAVSSSWKPDNSQRLKTISYNESNAFKTEIELQKTASITYDTDIDVRPRSKAKKIIAANEKNINNDNICRAKSSCGDPPEKKRKQNEDTENDKEGDTNNNRKQDTNNRKMDDKKHHKKHHKKEEKKDDKKDDKMDEENKSTKSRKSHKNDKHEDKKKEEDNAKDGKKHKRKENGKSGKKGKEKDTEKDKEKENEKNKEQNEKKEKKEKEAKERERKKYMNGCVVDLNAEEWAYLNENNEEVKQEATYMDQMRQQKLSYFCQRAPAIDPKLFPAWDEYGLTGSWYYHAVKRAFCDYFTQHKVCQSTKNCGKPIIPLRFKMPVTPSDKIYDVELGRRIGRKG